MRSGYVAGSVAGVRKRMRNTGEVFSADAHVVCRKDTFRYSLGDEPFIHHEPPPLGEERGEIIGAYAIIKLKNGEILRDVMDKNRIEQARKASRAPNGSMWRDFYDEGACKTVLKHCAKSAPQAAELERLLQRDEEPPSLGFDGGEIADLPEDRLPRPEPEPQRTIEGSGQVIDRAAEAFEVIDNDGRAFAFQTGERAAAALRQVYEEAARLGLARLEGAIESNAPTLEQLARSGFPDDAVALAAESDRLGRSCGSLHRRATARRRRSPQMMGRGRRPAKYRRSCEAGGPTGALGRRRCSCRKSASSATSPISRCCSARTTRT
jgi:RecT family